MVSEPTVTAADIARIAGVGPAAVSNWRRRYAEFPSPVGGTAGSPLFLLSEVVNWLEENGRPVRITPADEVWRTMNAARDPARPGAILAAAGFRLLREEPPAHLADGVPAALGADLDDLRETLGAAEAFEELVQRWAEAHARQFEATPSPVAELMCALAGPAAGVAPASLFDPACGTGGLLLRAAKSGTAILLGQDSDPDLAGIASVRLRLQGCGTVGVASGDSLLADAHVTARAQGVVCNPPASQRDWGRAELAYDTRWVYGLPPKGEPELAWLQHALAHLDDGGRAVLLMPASVASRPSGRRIRAELVRRGTLRAVVALPPASPRLPGIHLWLAEPTGLATPVEGVLFIDAECITETEAASSAGAPDWDALRDAVSSAWHRFRAGQTVDDDFASSVPLTELLGGDVDFTPARHIRTTAQDTVDLTVLENDHAAWLRSLKGLADALPAVQPATVMPEGPAETETSALVSLDDLIRTGALRVWRGGAARESTEAAPLGVPLLALEDGLSRTRPSGRTHAPGSELIGEGDVLVFAAAPEGARPAEEREYGAAPGPGVTVLRPERASLDPWFLAGAMTGGPGASVGTTGRRTRLDTGHLFLPVLMPEEQRTIGGAFRDLFRFEQALTAMADQGRRVARRLAEALAAGLVVPVDDEQE
ncbi:N-6 DNA methylase [Streptomyces sp. NPDC093252]|uniref:N-6 DNA methylase n=1 Tax=Streptomyces sp. NPDC093252 TaxID=3154980 RepID=UPI003430D7C5